MPRFALILLAPVAFASVGCAAIINGSSDTITVTSDPPGATIYAMGQGRINSVFWVRDIPIPDFSMNTEQSDTTPAILHLTKRHDWVLLVEKPGYQRAVIPIVRCFDGCIFLNIFNLFLFAWVDLHLGADWKALETSFHVKLAPLPKVASTTPPPEPSATPSPTPEPKKD